MKLDKKKEELIEKEKVLENARIELKKKFFGIDKVIDQFIDAISSWYLYPDLRTKPLIVNLWGITGVGKTDLVRSFVKLIQMSDNYCEIQSDSTDAYYLKDAIVESEFDDDMGVVFIDEFQKLKTIDEDNHEILEKNSSTAIDLWTFLSDGTFPVDYSLKSRIRNMIDDLERSKDIKKKTSDLSDYTLSKIRSLFFMTGIDKIYNINKIKPAQVLSIIKGIDKKMEVYENKVYNKVLVIIGANLDEAFDIYKEGYDNDTDADIYNELTNDIKVSRIKQALSKRFRQEQIARLGNIHIIYPVLSKQANKDLIKHVIDTTSERIKEQTGVTFIATQNLLDAIYKYGVYPVQGVRPIFSTVALFFENPIANFLIQKIKDNDGCKKITLDYRDHTVIGMVDKVEKYTFGISRTLESIKKDKTEDLKTIHSVHESGHAVAQAVLFNVAPRQLVSSVSQPNMGGFCTVYPLLGTKEQYEKKICIALAGRVAEELIFGEDKITSGASSDLKHATADILDYVTMYAMSDFIGVYDDDYYMSRPKEKDDLCEHYLKKLYDRTVKLIEGNKKFLLDVSDELIAHTKVEPDKFIEIASKYGYETTVKSFDEDIEDSFADDYKKFKENLKK